MYLHVLRYFINQQQRYQNSQCRIINRHDKRMCITLWIKIGKQLNRKEHVTVNRAEPNTNLIVPERWQIASWILGICLHTSETLTQDRGNQLVIEISHDNAQGALITKLLIEITFLCTKSQRNTANLLNSRNQQIQARWRDA